MQDLAKKLSNAEQHQAQALAADAALCMQCAVLQEALTEMHAELASTRAEHGQLVTQLQRVCAGEHALKEENLGLAAALERLPVLQAEAMVLQQENLELCAAAAAHGCELAAAQEAAAQQMAEVQEAAAAQLAEALEVSCLHYTMPSKVIQVGYAVQQCGHAHKCCSGETVTRSGGRAGFEGVHVGCTVWHCISLLCNHRLVLYFRCYGYAEGFPLDAASVYFCCRSMKRWRSACAGSWQTCARLRRSAGTPSQTRSRGSLRRAWPPR